MRQCLTATQSFFSCTVSQRNTRQQTDQASPFSWYSSIPSSMLARIIGLVSRPPLSSIIRREIISPIFVNVSSALFSSCIVSIPPDRAVPSFMPCNRDQIIPWERIIIHPCQAFRCIVFRKSRGIWNHKQIRDPLPVLRPFREIVKHTENPLFLMP